MQNGDLDLRRGWDVYAENGMPRDMARANMEHILGHFVACGWGGCYLGIFNKIISPYLDDVEVLKAFLSSPAIHEAGDIEKGRDGEVVFYDLFNYLMNVDSETIRQYLKETFPGFAKRFASAPFIL